MTTSKRPSSGQLQRIEDALVESLLQLSDQELRKELTDDGIDPEACIAEVDAAMAAVKEDVAREKLSNARIELSEWRNRRTNVDAAAKAAARRMLDQIRADDPALDKKITLAARKGEGLSERDLEGLIDDLAALEKLEQHNSNE